MCNKSLYLSVNNHTFVIINRNDMITAQINRIEQRINEIMELPLDDMLASMYMAEMYRLEAEREEMMKLIYISPKRLN